MTSFLLCGKHSLAGLRLLCQHHMDAHAHVHACNACLVKTWLFISGLVDSLSCVGVGGTRNVTMWYVVLVDCVNTTPADRCCPLMVIHNPLLECGGVLKWSCWEDGDLRHGHRKGAVGGDGAGHWDLNGSRGRKALAVVCEAFSAFTSVRLMNGAGPP